MLEEIPKHLTTLAATLSLSLLIMNLAVLGNGTVLILWGDPSVGNLWFPSDPPKIQNFRIVLHQYLKGILHCLHPAYDPERLHGTVKGT